MANTLSLSRNGASLLAKAFGVGFSAWLGLGGILNDCPSEFVAKVLEAMLANPVVIVQRGVALVQYVRIIFYHELRPAESAMVVVPIWICSIAAIWTVNESDAGKIVLLSAESPIKRFCHSAS